MAASQFVLTPIGVDFQGKTGKTVTVSVAPSDPSIVLNSVEYPPGTQLTVTGGKASFTILTGTNAMVTTIDIVAPTVTWRVIEVGTPSGSQDLDQVDSTDPNPFNSRIRIIGTDEA